MALLPESLPLPPILSEEFWCDSGPVLSLPPGLTHSGRPPITINLANFLGHTIPLGIPTLVGSSGTRLPAVSLPF